MEEFFSKRIGFRRRMLLARREKSSVANRITKQMLGQENLKGRKKIAKLAPTLEPALRRAPSPSSRADHKRG